MTARAGGVPRSPPREPTQAMLDAAANPVERKCWPDAFPYQYILLWRAMWDAAPATRAELSLRGPGYAPPAPAEAAPVTMEDIADRLEAMSKPAAPDALVARLREAEADYTIAWGDGDLYGEAADAIDTLQAQLEIEKYAHHIADLQWQESLKRAAAARKVLAELVAAQRTWAGFEIGNERMRAAWIAALHELERKP